MDHQNRRPNDVQWEVKQVFQDEETGLMVRVQVLPLRKPQYSIEIGQVRKDKDFSRYLRPLITITNGTVTIKSFNRDALNVLLEKAEEFVEKVTQTFEEEHKDDPVREQGDHRNRRNGRPRGQDRRERSAGD